MSDLDEKIKTAIADEDAQLMASFKEDDKLLLEMYSDKVSEDPLFISFKKGARQFTLPFWIAGFFLFCFAVFSGWKLFHVESTQAMLAWGVTLWIVVTMMLETSLWLSNEISRIWIGRELKRIELKLSQALAGSAKSVEE